MRFISVCSGIEAASVAWNPLGWEAEFLSEIEPFPCSLLSFRFPKVPNLGDMTKWRDWPSGTIGILVGGTPCQAFSVAGQRGGMDDPRGQLALGFCGIAAKYRPRWIVWENVPGVLSSGQGRDFGAFLGSLAGIGYSLAWRILDAQYFGVPQRRRRVFVVGHLGTDWRCPASVLFERESLSRNYSESGKKRKETSGTPGGRPSGKGGESSDRVVPTLTARISKGLGYDGQDERAGYPHLVLSPTVTSKWAKGAGGPAGDECQNLVAFHIAPTLTSGKDFGTSPKSQEMVAQIGSVFGSSAQVRRLTPKECERLMGFPDGWTEVQHRGKTAGDAPRLKSLGNSIAVPVLRWIGERIQLFERLEGITKGGCRNE
jgi:DNA (cytosine-5)-methyltransferase 1